MNSQTLLEFMSLCEKLKSNTRHSWTAEGMKESIAAHTFRVMIFSWLIKEEFPDIDMDRVLKLSLFHDLGEAITGDIPAFEKKDEDREIEKKALEKIVEMLPEPHRSELRDVFHEIEENQTKEAKLFQALDKMEAVIQHNEADIATWLPLEYELQLTYGETEAETFSYTKALREELRKRSKEKIEKEGK